MPAPANVSVANLRDWPAGPFRFDLPHALRLERVDPANDELEAPDFGPPVPDALQQLGESKALADCADAPRLREFWPQRFERVARLRCGAEATLPPVVQLESARQRLRATEEARERVVGWRTVNVE